MTNSGTRVATSVTTTAGWARSVITRLLRHLQHGCLTVIEDGRSQTYGSKLAGGIDATVTVRDATVWTSILMRAGVGLGESYMEAKWDTDDLVGVLHLLTLNLDQLNKVNRRITALRTAVRGTAGRLFKPSKETDRKNIAAHYDLGNEFFELFLDSTMAYSSGVYPSVTSSLEEASTHKFDQICRKLSLGATDHVIEIGTGWGGFAVHAASRYGCRVTTTTISARQFDHATQLVAEAGLSDRITVLNRDYRDLRGQFSSLVSIEMIEAVDWRLYDTFFSACAQLLAPDGQAAMQCIVINDADFDRTKTSEDFIKRYIFPGGCLPSVSAMLGSVARATDLCLTNLEDIGPHYVRTLNDWRQRLDAHWDSARALGFDDRFLRMWRFYFAYCAAGFAERHISVVQMVLARPAWRGAV